MRARLMLAVALLAGADTAGAGDAAGAVPPVELVTETVAGGTRVDLMTDGVLVDLAFATTADGTERVWALVRARRPDDRALRDPDGDEAARDEGDEDDVEPCPAPEVDPPVSLVGVDVFPTGGGGARLHAETTGIAARWVGAADLDGDGVDELLLGAADRVERIDVDATPAARTTVLTDPALADGRPVVLGRHGGAAWMRIAGVGRDRYLAFDVERDAFVERATIANRTHVAQGGHGLFVWSPPVAAVPDTADDAELLLAAWPRFEGGDRVQIDLVRPQAADDGARRVSCWGRLPGEERPIEQSVRMLDGDPVAIVTTVPIGGLNLFGEKRLRVIPLRRDRSRRGVSPLLAVDTRVNVWQSIEPALHDMNGDGRIDLVLAYWKGLKDDRVVLDTYLRNRAGGFELRPKPTAFDVDDGDRSFLLFGPDATGDDRPDLVLGGSGELRLYAGTGAAAPAVRRPVTARVPVGAGCGGQVQVAVGANGTVVSDGGRFVPRAVDLDGDGRVEIVVRRDGCVGPLVQLVRFASLAER